MSTYTEQDELEKLKAWWKGYGNAAIFGVALGVALLAGNRYWTEYKEDKLQSASSLYETMMDNLEQNRKPAVLDAAKLLVADYAATPYAGMAALVLAKLGFDSGDVGAARTQLRWAMENGRDPATVHTARLRLARVLADAGETEAALSLLEIKNTSGFTAGYEELRGDLLLRLDRLDEARAAYRAALADLPPGAPYSEVLGMKLDDLEAGVKP